MIALCRDSAGNHRTAPDKKGPGMSRGLVLQGGQGGPITVHGLLGTGEWLGLERSAGE